MEGFSLTEEEMQGYMDKLEQDASPAAELEMSESERQTLFNRLLVEKYSLSLITDIQVADDEITEVNFGTLNAIAGYILTKMKTATA